MKNLWIACSLVVLGGCGGADIRDAQEATPKAGAEVAILFTPRTGVYDAKARRAIFSAANGKAVGTFMSGFPDATRIAPGSYMFKVRCFDPMVRDSRFEDTFMLFQATVEAGHFYELTCNVMGASAIDRGTRFEAVKHLLHPDAAEKLRR